MQDIQEVVILMVVVFLEALVYLEEVSGVFREVSHLVLADSEGMDLAMEVGILMGLLAVAADYQADLVAEVGPADWEFQEVVGLIVLVDSVGSLEAEDLHHHHRRRRRHMTLLLPRRLAGRSATCRSRARSRS